MIGILFTCLVLGVVLIVTFAGSNSSNGIYNSVVENREVYNEGIKRAFKEKFGDKHGVVALSEPIGV